MEKICCAFADHVIIANDIWADRITKRSVAKKKCTTILNYPDPYIFHRRNIPRNPDKPFTLIYPGTLNWHQGLNIAVKAVAIVRQETPNVQLHVYGRGPEENNLKALAESLNLSGNIKFHGVLSLEEVAEKMEEADAGVVPKRADGFGNEAFSTKIYEFMTLGVPAIVSRTKIDQYYFNDSLVFFFEPGSEHDLALKISECIADSEKRRKIAANAYAFIQEHTWDVRKAVYFDLVDSLVGIA